MRITALPFVLLMVVPTSYADDFRPRAAAAPDLAHPKRFQSNGLSFQLPVDWRITANDALQDTEGRGVSIQADKSAFEVLNLDVVVQVVRTKVAASFEGMAQYLYKSEVDDKAAQYTQPNFAPFMLDNKYPALASRYTHTIFNQGELYAHRLDLVTRKVCGKGWTCVILSSGLAANESAAKQGMARIYETIRYEP
ncbi:MAG: hypothetical protein GAK33_06152 [Burkholderia lata]|uniref:Uncharacterized protein n=1 Tax=Burkholderia lata (strain ATCC 17760 / DSM 23089 / LMG 22485 / NCIMB 9086 / R18194 / 383) TaxID=482957 RepID=A0A833UX59_BURL3|nr:hypothetical protein [Burkholderia lata]KAF1033807.1 MAG: hypothetical protein GAK33_06152 [Burkholderia lata]